MIKIYTLIIFVLVSLTATHGFAADSNADGPFKWHPGHYVFLGDYELIPVATELADYSAVRGFQKRYYWDDLEPEKGNYDFSEIISDLNYLQSQGKYLVIQLQLQTFINSIRSPGYIQTAEYDGGVFQAESTNGWYIKFYNSQVLLRLKALVDTLGTVVDNHPALAVFNFTETSFPSPKDPVEAENWGSKVTLAMQNMASMASTARNAFPTTPTIQYFNHPRQQYELFENSSLNTGIGLGAPDIIIGGIPDPAGNSTYDVANRLKGKIPIGYSVQWNNWIRDVNGYRDIHPIEFQEYARDILGCNFIFWIIRYPYWNDLKLFWANLSFNGDPAGGLITACPSLASAGCNPTNDPISPHSGEVLVFDVLNRSLNKNDHGVLKAEAIPVPSEQIMAMIPGSNSNWTNSPDLSEGTLHFRAKIIEQPVPKNMNLQFSIWQDDLDGNRLGIKNFSPPYEVSGEKGTVVTWSIPVSSLIKEDEESIDWSRARERFGLVVKNAQGYPVSDENNLNWSGENPDEWYPLIMRFTVVAVGKDQVFSGWAKFTNNTFYELPPTQPSSSGELVAFWNFDEASGNILTDLSGKNNHLTMSGSANRVVGISDKALKLDGSYNTCAIIQDASLSPSFPAQSTGSPLDALTIAAWIKPASLDDRNPIITKEQEGKRGFEFGLKNGYLSAQIFRDAEVGSRVEYTGTILEKDSWQHVAMTYQFVTDGNSIVKFYINGMEDYATYDAVGPLQRNSAPVRLGHYFWKSNYQRYFNGLIDEAKVYTRVLDGDDIRELYNAVPLWIEKSGINQGFTIYPNPVNNSSIIKYNLPVKSDVIIGVYNVHGQEVLRLTEAHSPAGNYNLPFYPESLSKGLYFIKLQTKEISLSKKVIIN